MDIDSQLETITPTSVEYLTLGGLAGVAMPAGTTGDRPTAPINGIIRYNTTTPALEGYVNSTWISLGGSGTVTSVGISAPGVFTVSGSPVTSSGTISLSLTSQPNNTIFAGPPSSGPSTPYFRTISLVQGDLSDVAVSTPTANQVLAYDGGTSKWINTGSISASASGTVGVSPTNGGTGWTQISGTLYRADFVHNLGTTDVVVTLWDASNNAVVITDSVVTFDTNTIRVTVRGNSKTLKVVVIANGLVVGSGGSSGPTVLKSFTYYANSLDTPVNADFTVNSIAAAVTDPTYISMNVRSFSNTVEQGVAGVVSIPLGATTLTIKMRGRAQTAPGSASVVQPRLYTRRLPNNAAVGAWSAATELANISIPTNAYFQYSTQTVNLSTLGLLADSMYQFEITRRVSGVVGTNLASPYLMAEITLEFA